MFDHEGRRRNVTFVDCSCLGVAYPINTSPESTGLLRYEALCEHIDERDDLIDHVNYHGITDIIIGGCTSKPLPNSFKDSLKSIRCSLRGLDLLGLQGSLPQSNDQLSTEVSIAMTNIVDPWNKKQRIDNVRLEIDKSSQIDVDLIDSTTWSEQTTGRTRVNVSTWTHEEKESFR
jgi:hypothetical protein